MCLHPSLEKSLGKLQSWGADCQTSNEGVFDMVKFLNHHPLYLECIAKGKHISPWGKNSQNLIFDRNGLAHVIQTCGIALLLCNVKFPKVSNLMQ